METLNKLIISAVLFLAGLLAGVFAGRYVESNVQQKRIQNYYTSTEALLDSCAEYDCYFLDVMTETDTYEDYVSARNALLMTK